MTSADRDAFAARTAEEADHFAYCTAPAADRCGYHGAPEGGRAVPDLHRDKVRDAYDDAQMILGAALGGDPAAVADGFDDVLSRVGIGGAYHVALCLAATMVGDDVRGGGAALEYPGIDEATYDARWVARFVSAYVNADRPTGEALLGAAVADGQFGACMATLAGSTLETLRRRMG